MYNHTLHCCAEFGLYICERVTSYKNTKGNAGGSQCFVVVVQCLFLQFHPLLFMLDASAYLLFLKLCRHIPPRPRSLRIQDVINKLADWLPWCKPITIT